MESIQNTPIQRLMEAEIAVPGSGSSVDLSISPATVKQIRPTKPGQDPLMNHSPCWNEQSGPNMASPPTTTILLTPSKLADGPVEGDQVFSPAGGDYNDDDDDHQYDVDQFDSDDDQSSNNDANREFGDDNDGDDGFNVNDHEVDDQQTLELPVFSSALDSAVAEIMHDMPDEEITASRWEMHARQAAEEAAMRRSIAAQASARKQRQRADQEAREREAAAKAEAAKKAQAEQQRQKQLLQQQQQQQLHARRPPTVARSQRAAGPPPPPTVQPIEQAVRDLAEQVCNEEIAAAHAAAEQLKKQRQQQRSEGADDDDQQYEEDAVDQQLDLLTEPPADFIQTVDVAASGKAGKFMVGDRQVNVQFKGKNVVVRTGGGWLPFVDFAAEVFEKLYPSVNDQIAAAEELTGDRLGRSALAGTAGLRRRSRSRSRSRSRHQQQQQKHQAAPHSTKKKNRSAPPQQPVDTVAEPAAKSRAPVAMTVIDVTYDSETETMGLSPDAEDDGSSMSSPAAARGSDDGDDSSMSSFHRQQPSVTLMAMPAFVEEMEMANVPTPVKQTQARQFVTFDLSDFPPQLQEDGPYKQMITEIYSAFVDSHKAPQKGDRIVKSIEQIGALLPAYSSDRIDVFCQWLESRKLLTAVPNEQGKYQVCV